MPGEQKKRSLQGQIITYARHEAGGEVEPDHECLLGQAHTWTGEPIKRLKEEEDLLTLHFRKGCSGGYAEVS